VNVVKQAIGGQDRAFVAPPQVDIGSGAAKVKSVRWTNATDDTAWFWFPNGHKVFEGGEEYFSKLIEIPKHEALPLDVLESPKKGDYHYHVYCKAVEDCAHGNSEPGVHVP